MGQDELDHADIDADCDRAGALRRAVAAEANEAIAVESHNVALVELTLQHRESCGFGAQRSLADVAHVVDMTVDEISKGFSPRDARLVRSLVTIDLTLGLDGSASCIFTPQKGLAHVASLTADLGAPRLGGELGQGGHFSCALRVHSAVETWRKGSHHGVFSCALGAI